MLTFEWIKNDEMLEIHGDNNGLLELSNMIEKLILSEKNEHLHLMTEEWGGSELSSDKQNGKSHLIHHVKILKWG